MMLFLLPLWSALAAEPPSTDAWEATLDRVVPSVVAIRTSSPRAFDTDNAGNSVATGFVVDAERGILLTNRHVVQPGPVVAEAVFLDHEEVPLQAIYRDPVHDFGFYRFDPDDLKFMEVRQVELRPEHARVGVEVRLVGNDAGEKVSILGGTLARLDRDAPRYGRGYNDFDTFYFQAASSSSGGSSGSPVFDVHGHVIALNAGGSRRAASSFFLPLDRVQRALELVRAGEPVPRGTLQTVLRYRPYDEVRRLGVSPETEGAARAAFPDGTGMLVVDEVVPGGPAAGKLAPGDVVVRLNGQLVSAFVPWEAVLDDSVAAPVTVEVERGGEPLSVTLTVQDLHAITPSAYLEFGGGVLNALSFQKARSHGVPVDSGVYVASSGYALGNAGIGEGAILTAIGDRPVRTVAEAEAALAALPDRARVPVRWFQIDDPRRQQLSLLTVDRRWYPLQTCVRDDGTGEWPCTPAAAPPEAAPEPPDTVAWPATDAGPGRKLQRSLVWMQVTIPYRIEGVHAASFYGTGLVVDAERGLVLTDRNTVPLELGDVTLTFGAAHQVPAEVLWVHPLHNLAVVKYDPAALGDTPVQSATFRVKELEPGDKLWHVALTRRQEVAAQSSKVRRVDPLHLGVPSPPLYRDANIEVVGLGDTGPGDGGVLVDRMGRVLALWASWVDGSGDRNGSFFRGLPSELILEALGPLRDGREPALRTLGVELRATSLADARNLGLPAEEAAILAQHAPDRREVLQIVRLLAGSPAADLLDEGDLVLAVDGGPVTRFREVELGSQQEQVVVRILRDGEVRDVHVPTVTLEGWEVDRAVLWAGVILHEPHLAVSAQRGIPDEGVYVSWFWSGSPASRDGLRATHRILEVDGQPTPDLDAFLAAVDGRADRSAVRLRTEDLDGKRQVVAVRLDLRYWPTAELVKTEQGWIRKER